MANRSQSLKDLHFSTVGSILSKGKNPIEDMSIEQIIHEFGGAKKAKKDRSLRRSNHQFHIPHGMHNYTQSTPNQIFANTQIMPTV